MNGDVVDGSSRPEQAASCRKSCGLLLLKRYRETAYVDLFGSILRERIVFTFDYLLHAAIEVKLNWIDVVAVLCGLRSCGGSRCRSSESCLPSKLSKFVASLEGLPMMDEYWIGQNLS